MEPTGPVQACTGIALAILICFDSSPKCKK